MLRKIILDNYTTYFGEPTEIDFSATDGYQSLQNDNIGSGGVLKGALFVGENASGKTKILEAIRLLVELFSGERKIDFARYGSFYTKSRVFKIKYEFLFRGTTIKYFIEIDNKKIVKEDLIVDDDQILERRNNKAKFSLGENHDVSEGNLSNELLFLRRVYFSSRFYGNNILEDWYDYVANSIYINCLSRHIMVGSSRNDANSRMEEIVLKNFLDKNGPQKINSFFKSIGYKQSIIYNSKTPTSKRHGGYFALKDEKFVSFNKEGTDVYIPEWFESSGNRALLNVLPPVFYAIENNRMLIINEFSSGLSNELEEALVKYFYHFSKDSQLFFTSHSTNILNNSIIRPDQIYSVRFTPDRGSVLARFSDQSPRESQNTEKMYLNGVFDAVPNYTKNF